MFLIYYIWFSAMITALFQQFLKQEIRKQFLIVLDLVLVNNTNSGSNQTWCNMFPATINICLDPIKAQHWDKYANLHEKSFLASPFVRVQWFKSNFMSLFSWFIKRFGSQESTCYAVKMFCKDAIERCLVFLLHLHYFVAKK